MLKEFILILQIITDSEHFFWEIAETLISALSGREGRYAMVKKMRAEFFNERIVIFYIFYLFCPAL